MRRLSPCAAVCKPCHVDTVCNLAVGVGACYVETVWPESTAPLFKYLQCVHGSHHHSFIFIGGKFIGDGFALQAGWGWAGADCGAMG